MAHDPGAYAGTYDSPLYGPLRVDRTGAGFDVSIAGYPATLTHWSGDTFMLSFPNPDISPGLITFAFGAGRARARSFDGTRVPATPTANYGHFDRR